MVKTKKEYFNIQKDIYFGAVYIVPSNFSSDRSKFIDADNCLILRKEIFSFSSLGGHFILGGGDFNSRLGNKFKDYIMSDLNDFLPIDNTLQTDSSSFTYTHRYIQNKNTNTNGKHLADLCLINNLKILSGRKIGNLVGKYTCHHYNGCSTLDYIITETDVF